MIPVSRIKSQRLLKLVVHHLFGHHSKTPLKVAKQEPALPFVTQSEVRGDQNTNENGEKTTGTPFRHRYRGYQFDPQEVQELFHRPEQGKGVTHMARRPRNPSLCGRGGCGIWHDHPFEPSGTTKEYGCVQSGQCRTRGLHEACTRCGWPADEHPTVAIAHVLQGGQP